MPRGPVTQMQRGFLFDPPVPQAGGLLSESSQQISVRKPTKLPLDVLRGPPNKKLI
jgi:hypothetical protein